MFDKVLSTPLQNMQKIIPHLVDLYSLISSLAILLLGLLLFPLIHMLTNSKKYVVVIARCPVQYGKYFPVSHILQLMIEIIEKYEKRGRYLPILHEATCDNYFIVKCLFKSNESTVILLTYQLPIIWL